jgi:hypothetical protein
MGTMQRLNAYSTALEKWASKKRRYDLLLAQGTPEKKPLEHEPIPQEFEILPPDMEWAEKIMRKILAPKIVEPSLDSQLPKIKMPVRKTI